MDSLSVSATRAFSIIIRRYCWRGFWNCCGSFFFFCSSVFVFDFFRRGSYRACKSWSEFRYLNVYQLANSELLLLLCKSNLRKKWSLSKVWLKFSTEFGPNLIHGKIPNLDLAIRKFGRNLPKVSSYVHQTLFLRGSTLGFSQGQTWVIFCLNSIFSWDNVIFILFYYQ